MLRILPSRPSSVLPCSSRHAIQPRFSLELSPCACPPFNGARASDVDQFSWLRDFPASPFRGRETVSENRLTCPFRGRETVSRLSYYTIHATTANRPLSGRAMHFQFAQYLDLARFNRSASWHERNRTSLSTVILNYRRWMWPFAHGAQQRCHRSRRQDSTTSARMECTRRHTVLFRKYRCAPEHPLFYADISFPFHLSIQKERQYSCRQVWWLRWHHGPGHWRLKGRP